MGGASAVTLGGRLTIMPYYTVVKQANTWGIFSPDGREVGGHYNDADEARLLAGELEDMRAALDRIMAANPGLCC
jgi:hypothetical protein